MSAATNGDRREGGERDPLGKSALFSGLGARPVTRLRPARPPRPGKAALYSVPPPPADWQLTMPGLRVEVVCSSCHERSVVDLVELALLHVPFFLWVPWLRYSRFIACPACERRTWVGVNWAGLTSLS